MVHICLNRALVESVTTLPSSKLLKEVNGVLLSKITENKSIEAEEFRLTLALMTNDFKLMGQCAAKLVTTHKLPALVMT